MEIGSSEHKKLLINSILKMSVKTMAIGLAVGLFLLAPSLLVVNQFSTGLALAGQMIILVSVIYALSIALKKFWVIRSSFFSNK